ncbi:MAG: hypothetical protein LC104_19410 [Bacteroidales bacterium]|nr:hypothetical protein [Bacteroidales bacterium]
MRRLLAILGVVGVASDSWAADFSPAPPPLVSAISQTALVQSWIVQLASDGFHDRTQAAQQLLRLGDSALPELEHAARFAGEYDTRMRAAELAAAIRAQGVSARIVAVGPLTLDYQGVPLATVVADLKKKTGIPLVLHPTGVVQPMRPIVLTTENVTPWQAVAELCRVAGLEEVVPETFNPRTIPGHPMAERKRTAYSLAELPRLSPGSVPVILTDGQGEPQAADCRTAVRVSALPAAFTGNRVIRGLGETVLTLDVTPLPKLNWESITSIHVQRVLDEAGRPLATVPFHDESNGFPAAYAQNIAAFGGLGGQQVWIEDQAHGGRASEQSNPRLLAIRIRTADRTISRLQRLEGVVIGQVVQPNQTLIQIEDLPKSVGTMFTGPGDTRLTILAYETGNPDAVIVRVRAEYPNPYTMQRLGFRGAFAVAGVLPPPFGGAVSLGNVGQLTLTDAVGKMIRQVHVSNSQMSDDGFKQTYEMEMTIPHRSASATPQKLLVIGSKPMQVAVPFRLENVRMP